MGTKLTTKLIEKVAAKLLLGNYRMTAFAMVDVPRRTWQEWIQKGKAVRDETKEDPDAHHLLCAELVMQVERSEALALSKIIGDVATSDDDRVKMTFLERRYNKMFSRNPNAVIDEEAGEESELVPRDILAAKIADIVTRRLLREGEGES